MNMNQARADILADIQSRQSPRELVVAKTPLNKEIPREVLKKKKIKRYNNVSRMSEESGGFMVSGETSLLAETSSPPLGLSTSSLSFGDSTSCQEESGIVICPRELASRDPVSAISVQHARTQRGIKVMVTIQKASQVATGEVTRLTAELKRWDRLRELRPYADDSEAFAEMYADALEQLRSMPPDQRRNYCIGRLHDRGARSAWYADIMMLGVLDSEHTQLKQVLLNIEGQEFEIAMDLELSARQTMYHSQGRSGDLKRSRPAPRLATAPSERW